MMKSVMLFALIALGNTCFADPIVCLPDSPLGHPKANVDKAVISNDRKTLTLTVGGRELTGSLKSTDDGPAFDEVSAARTGYNVLVMEVATQAGVHRIDVVVTTYGSFDEDPQGLICKFP